jgi:hypothetical protein
VWCRRRVSGARAGTAGAGAVARRRTNRVRQSAGGVQRISAGQEGAGALEGAERQAVRGLAARNKEIQGLSERIQSQGTIVDPGVLKQWNQDLARLQREAQFAEQEAQVQRDDCSATCWRTSKSS